jgi:CheY-like chemotaxis protein
MKPTILLAEDNPESRYLFCFILAKAGCEVLQAQNGVEAVEKSKNLVPDLIIMDIQMPVMDGYEAVSLMRKDPRLEKTPIVGLSAFAMATDREKALKHGFNGYIEKPIELDTFVKELSTYLPAIALP